jgi:catechol 2,3-dioxygenase-like lactoylglutathione lyase family enzyme
VSALATGDLIGFVPTTDLVRARAFFESRLGLRCAHEDGFAAVFDANGTMLRVTLVPELLPAPFTILGWKVDDISSSARALAACGVELVRFVGMEQDEDGVWTAPGGDRVAWFRDPDGNTLSLTELAAAG